MKIRLMGTMAELEVAKDYYQALEKEDFVKSVLISKPYQNRGSSTIFRLYVEIEYTENYIKNNYKQISTR